MNISHLAYCLETESGSSNSPWHQKKEVGMILLTQVFVLLGKRLKRRNIATDGTARSKMTSSMEWHMALATTT